MKTVGGSLDAILPHSTLYANIQSPGKIFDWMIPQYSEIVYTQSDTFSFHLMSVIVLWIHFSDDNCTLIKKQNVFKALSEKKALDI